MRRLIDASYNHLDAWLECIDEPNRGICKQILADHKRLLEKASASIFNHHAWEGGYVDHVVECMNYAQIFYEVLIATRRGHEYTLSDVLLVLFVQDLERLLAHTNKTLMQYGLSLSVAQLNALECLNKGFDPRVGLIMGPLGAFCFMVDMFSAYGKPHHPKEEGEEWTGAQRSIQK